MKKLYYTYEKIHQLIQKISLDINNDQWLPDCIIAISGGGLIPARILRNYIERDILIVGVKRYIDHSITHDVIIKIQWIDEVERKIKNKRILLIDEVDDTRITLSYCLKELRKHSPKEIRVAVIHQKDKEKGADFPKDIKHVYTGEIIGDEWICYPWEAKDIEDHYQQCFSNDKD